MAGRPTGRSWAGAPGSVDGRLKLTEQGEVIAANYCRPGDRPPTPRAAHRCGPASPARRSTTRRPRPPCATAPRSWTSSRRRPASAYRALVHDDPGFAAFFREITPIAELSDLRLGSRPAARGRAGAESAADDAPSIDALRAIPWTFAWSQSRINLPGWYGLGSALEAFAAVHGDAGLAAIARLHRTWPFLASVLDNAEMILAKADMGIGPPVCLARRDGRTAMPAGPTIEAEYQRTVACLLRVTGRDRLLDGAPVLQRSIALRNPYVDALSEVQVRLLRRLRALPPDDPERDAHLRLVQLSVNGVAAGLQNTG